MSNDISHNILYELKKFGQIINANDLAERRPEPRRETIRDRLELNDYKWKFGRYVVTKNKCNCRTCPVCGRRRGVETRRNLLRPDVLMKFKYPALLTFTINPKNFDSPEKAHDIVTSGGYIRRVLRLLGIDTWIWVLEFQKSGWPHWHIIADLSKRGGLCEAELRRIWHLWRDKWGLGGFDIQRRDRRFENAAHAMNYITKYLTKPEKSPFPEWFLKGSRYRMCQASKKVGRITDTKNKVVETNNILHIKKKRKASKSLKVRMLACGTESIVLHEMIDKETFQSTYRYIGKLSASTEELKKWNEEGYLTGVVSWGRIMRLGYTKIGMCIKLPHGEPRNCLDVINEAISEIRKRGKVA